jgi:mono/diheme cytochrome c family protein
MLKYNLILLTLTVSFSIFSVESVDFDMPLREFYNLLGEKDKNHYTGPYKASEISTGKDLFTKGQAISPTGELGEKISQVFTCTHCHNSVIEDPDLAINDPEARLSMAKKNMMPFLQGTTMYGSVNRSTWFNDDYIKKYGEIIIKPARKNFINAVKLCSKECSVGRDLANWELRGMLAYLWTLEYKLKDLNFNQNEKEVINDYKSHPKNKVFGIIGSKFLNKSAATFVEPPQEGSTYGTNADPTNGKIIFERSCIHCHGLTNKISGVIKFRDNLRTYKYLSKYKHNYYVLRKGIDSSSIYMPHYSLEKMSNKQADDFYAFIKSKLRTF